MIWMLTFMLSSVAFGHIMRYGHERNRNMVWVGTWNYIAATVFCTVWWALQPEAPLHWGAPVYAAPAGLALVCAYFFMNASIRLVGVGITQCVGRLSVAVPVAASIWIWREVPGVVRGLGIALALVSFPLLTSGGAGSASDRSRRKVWMLLGLFATAGSIAVFVKAYAQVAPVGSEPAFLSFMFGTAALGNLVAAAWRGGRTDARDFLHGVVLGAPNILANFAILRALAHLAGTVVFSSTSAGTIILTTTVAAILWRERFSKRALVGMGIAIVALVMINLPLTW